MVAWWSGNVAELLASEPEAIVQRMTMRLVETHHLNLETSFRVDPSAQCNGRTDSSGAFAQKVRLRAF